MQSTRLSILFFIVLCTCIFGGQSATAQSVHDAGVWTSLNTQGPLDLIQINDQRMKWWFDAHARFADDSDGYLQSIMRPGVGYAIGDKTTVWLGYAWIHDSPVNNAPSFHENRIWQQLTTSRDLGRGTLSFRSRLEQRFITTGDDVGWRFRQFVKFKVPLGECTPVSAVVWDEVFLDLNSTDTGQTGSFSQNRVFAGLGWELCGGKSSSIEIGYFNQYLRRRQSDDRMSHNVGINYFRKF